MKPSNQEPHYERVAEQLHSLLRHGQWQVGERLPSERALATRFGISRNGVREAIRALAERGLLVTRRGAGTFVTEPSEQAVFDALARAIGSRRERLRELFELRLIIEPHIAALAAKRISPPQLTHLKAFVLDQQRCLAESKSDAHIDAAFHEELANACGNTVVRDMMHSLRTILLDTRVPELRPRIRRSASIQDHLELIGALEQRDPERARRLMAAHVAAMQKLVLGTET
jgi:GntR family transcriptional repressor for pyruvate dehydrogenase complex